MTNKSNYIKAMLVNMTILSNPGELKDMKVTQLKFLTPRSVFCWPMENDLCIITKAEDQNITFINDNTGEFFTCSPELYVVKM